MLRVLMRLLLWLLMTALPIQGVAAAAMPSCMPSHHATTAGTALPATSHGHMAAVDAAHGHDMDDAAPAMKDASHAMQHGGKGHSCNACAACFTSAAAPPSAQPSPAPDGGATVAADLKHRLFPDHVPAMPERPPRTVAA